MASRKNPPGAPPRYKTAEEMQEKIDAYFIYCKGIPAVDHEGTPLRDNQNRVICDDARPPTVTGLALWLGFTSRQALLNYQNKPAFVDTITRAKAKCEQYAEERLYYKESFNGAQFSLRANFGWQDKPEQKAESEVQIVDDL